MIKGYLGLSSEEEKQETEEKQEAEKDLLAFVKETLDGQAADVRLSNALVSHAVCLTTEGQITLEMERYFRSIPGDDGTIRAQRVLELNAGHPAFAKLRSAFETDRERCGEMAKVLYGMACMIAGMPVDDPAEFSDIVCDLL